MKPVNIYSLTRVSDNSRLSGLERHMSGRRNYLKIKDWETDGLRRLCDTMAKTDPKTTGYNFYYSFSMPKLGKEFDLLRIGSDSLINIELKSGNTSDENILKQLIQNRYYLSAMERTVWYFTFISDSGRLVRLSNTGRLVEADFGELCHLLDDQTDVYEDDIEDLFKEANYLISPLTDPDRFLRGDYFLTFQQRDIGSRIIRDLKYPEQKYLDKNGNIEVRGFSGYPGTGKTLLLYDIAMHLTQRDRVCIIHIGPKTPQLERLNQLLKRIDFYYAGIDLMTIASEKYRAILVDEGHRLTPAMWEQIMELAKHYKAPIILSYNSEDAVSPEERTENGTTLIESSPGFTGYKLTNRIRLSTELSAFIRALMHLTESHRRDYPSVSISYSNDKKETAILLHNLMNDSYDHIREADCEFDGIPVYSSFSREFDQVVMIIDKDFYYDDLHYLRDRRTSGKEKNLLRRSSRVSNLFHGLSRAKRRIALIIEDNPSVFDVVLRILQK